MHRAAALLFSLAAAPVAAQGIGGTWRGLYQCGQGSTALTLTIAPAGKERVNALFHFEAAPDNPAVPAGCFEMTGRFEALSGRLTLDPSFWIARPADYVMVGLRGEMRGDTIAGQVEGPGCTEFRLARRSIPSAIAACRSLRRDVPHG